jgi:hypothetical protein
MTESNRPWCIEQGHKPNPLHTAAGFCAMTWELGITKEDNPEEWRECKRLFLNSTNRRAVR